jgi:hypothetical protein
MVQKEGKWNSIQLVGKTGAAKKQKKKQRISDPHRIQMVPIDVLLLTALTSTFSV